MSNATATPAHDVDMERIALRATLPPTAAKPAEPRKIVVPGGDEPAPPPRVHNRINEPRPDLAFPKDEPKKKTPTGPADLDRAGFPNRAMFPEAIACGLISTAWLMGVMPYLPTMFQTPEVQAAIPGTYGLFVGVKWLFRQFAGGYRLTDKEILQVIPGPIPDPAPIELNRIAAVTVEQTPLEWCLGVGRLRVSYERDTQPEELLGPVSWPKARAKKIEEAMSAARGANVVTGRTAA